MLIGRCVSYSDLPGWTKVPLGLLLKSIHSQPRDMCLSFVREDDILQVIPRDMSKVCISYDK